MLFLAIAILATGAIVLSVTDKEKLEQFIVASCSNVKKGIESIDIPTGNWQCQKPQTRQLRQASKKITPPKARQTSADFTIDGLGRKDKKGRFWQDKPSNQWLMWGATSEPENDFTINVRWKDYPDQFTGSLRRSLRKMKRFRLGRITVASSYNAINVHGGTFEILPFIFKDQSLLKQCIGFTNKQRNDSVLVRGWLCAAPQSTPSIDKLECLLSSLAIDGIISPDRSANWCPGLKGQSQS